MGYQRDILTSPKLVRISRSFPPLEPELQVLFEPGTSSLPKPGTPPGWLSQRFRPGFPGVRDAVRIWIFFSNNHGWWVAIKVRFQQSLDLNFFDPRACFLDCCLEDFHLASSVAGCSLEDCSCNFLRKHSVAWGEPTYNA